MPYNPGSAFSLKSAVAVYVGSRASLDVYPSASLDVAIRSCAPSYVRACCSTDHCRVAPFSHLVYGEKWDRRNWDGYGVDRQTDIDKIAQSVDSGYLPIYIGTCLRSPPIK